MLGIRNVVNKIFSITDIWLDPEDTLSSEYTSVTEGSVRNSTSYMFSRFLSFPWAMASIYKGREYA